MQGIIWNIYDWGYFTMKVENKGFASFEALIILLFVLVFIISCGIVLSNQNLFISKYNKEIYGKQKINQIENQVLSIIKETASNHENSMFDEMWRYNENLIDNVLVHIEEKSSKLNINSIPIDFVSILANEEDCDIKKISNILNDYRDSSKLILNIEEFKGSVTEEVFNKYFNWFNWNNINVMDDKAFSNFLNILNLSGAYYENKRKPFIVSKQFINSTTELKFFFGVDYSYVSPYINIYPEMNVNMISEELLQKFLKINQFKISNPESKAYAIISYRNEKPIKEEDLMNLLGISKNNEIYYYLGCKSWIWEILLSYDKLICELKICRIPNTDTENQESFSLIEKRWL